MLERSFVATRNHSLADNRLYFASRAPNTGIFDGRIAPTEKLLSFLGTDFFQTFFAVAAFFWIRRQKYVADAVAARRRQLDSQFLHRGAEEFVRHLDENAGPVASKRIASAGAAVRQVHQDFQPLPDN